MRFFIFYSCMLKRLNRVLAFIFLFYTFTLASQEMKPSLAQHRFNVYSQFGEDGIIQKIFETIGTQSKVCIEFGAWDGLYLSNTAILWAHQGWKGVLIESDENRFNQMADNTKNYDCLIMNEKVGIGPSNSLEAILKKHAFNAPIDLLSIDIDNDDYYIFDSLVDLKPRVIICEYNPTMPAHLDIYPEYGKNEMGCSVSALMRVGKEKGYSLIAITDCNCFFVKDEEIEKFSNFEIALDKIKIDRYLRYVITDYKGKYTTVASKEFVDPYGFVAPLESAVLGSVKQVN